jgi:hypothetical protein
MIGFLNDPFLVKKMVLLQQLPEEKVNHSKVEGQKDAKTQRTRRGRQGRGKR